MSQIEWLPEALADLKRMHDFLVVKDVVVATRAIARLRQTAALLESTAELGRPMKDGAGRELVVMFGAGSYVLRYRIARSGVVVVLRVWHSREVGVQ